MARTRLTMLLIVATTAVFVPGASASNHLIKRPATMTTNLKKLELQNQVKQEQANLKKLQTELEAINDRSGYEKFMDGLFGSDGGAGRTIKPAEARQRVNELQRNQIAPRPCKFRSSGC